MFPPESEGITAAPMQLDGPYAFADQEPEDPLAKYYDSDNIAEDLDEEKLKKIGKRCKEGFDVDEQSRKPWLEKNKEALKLATQEMETKTFPWRGAANVKIPLITDAAIKFAARCYSEIIRDDKVVKGSVIGEDPTGQKQERAERVGDYMSWQLMEKEKEWESDTDRLVHILPVVGHMFRKRYWNPGLKRTQSEIRLPDKVCINYQAASLESARRVTDIIENVSQNTLISNQRSGIWLDVDLKPEGKETTIERDSLDEQDYYTFLEQYCWLDLDEDGYEEPYIVTLEKESCKVVRILADYDEDTIYRNDKNEITCIERKQTFTDYIFMPSLDGGYYGTGFGQLMQPLNKVANSIFNQLLDAGTLANVQGGFLSKEIKVRGGRYEFEPNEWKKTTASAEQLRYGVHALPIKEPSATLFNLLGLVMELTQDLSSVKDVLSGDSPGMNVPATTVMALIEQGMKTFNAIYKRIYRSLKKEYKQLYNINHEYMDDTEYFTVLDVQQQVTKEDFEDESLDIVPIADPNMSSDMQRLARAEALKGLIGAPGVNPRPILILWMEAMRVPKDQIEAILPEQDPNQIPPELMAMQQELEFKEAEIKVKEQDQMLKDRELDLKEREMEAKIVETITKALKNIADAEAAEAGPQLQLYQAVINSLQNQDKLDREDMNEQRRLAAMGQQSSNTESGGTPQQP